MPCRYLSFALLIALSIANVHAEVPTNRAVSEAAQTIVQRELSTAGPGAAVLVAKGDQVIFRSAGGRADIELAVPLDPRNIFRIGSITKTLTATTILKMVATSQLALQDRLSKFLPEFPNGENISIASLLNHTAGISDAWDANPADAMSTADLVRAIGRQPPDFPPGTEWRYSNSGYLILAQIVEKVSGQSFSQFLQQYS